jgi:chromatin structure-remodeling complex subunit SFH1
VWNIHDTLTKPEAFAKIFCHDLDIPPHPWADTVTNQIRAQLEEHESVAALELGSDGAMDVDATLPNVEELPECRVILSVSLSKSLFSNLSLSSCRSMSRLPTTI